MPSVIFVLPKLVLNTSLRSCHGVIKQMPCLGDIMVKRCKELNDLSGLPHLKQHMVALMAQCKTLVTPLSIHGSYHSLAPSHQHALEADVSLKQHAWGRKGKYSSEYFFTYGYFSFSGFNLQFIVRYTSLTIVLKCGHSDGVLNISYAT